MCVCVKFVYVKLLYVKFVCVKLLYVKFVLFVCVCCYGGGGRRRRRRRGIQNQKLKDRITPQVNFSQQATKERQRQHGISKKEKRDGEGLVWGKLCVDEYV